MSEERAKEIAAAFFGTRDEAYVVLKNLIKGQFDRIEADVREECAKICDNFAEETSNEYEPRKIARLIRKAGKV